MQQSDPHQLGNWSASGVRSKVSRVTLRGDSPCSRGADVKVASRWVSVKVSSRADLPYSFLPKSVRNSIPAKLRWYKVAKKYCSRQEMPRCTRKDSTIVSNLLHVSPTTPFWGPQDILTFAHWNNNSRDTYHPHCMDDTPPLCCYVAVGCSLRLLAARDGRATLTEWSTCV
jgi:hypothetical protein